MNAAFHRSGSDYEFDECLEILRIADLIEEDTLVYKCIEAVALSASWRHNRHPLTEGQKNQVAQKIVELSSKKFPNLRYIKHEGFGILAEGQSLRLLREKHADWKPLMVRAKALQNSSDKTFVLTFLAGCMHSGLLKERLHLLQEAATVSETIPSVYDRVERVRLIATVAQDIDVALARSLVTKGMLIVKDGDNEDASESRLRLVDFAYQLDPDLASSLASSLDSDEARRAARERIEYQEFKTSFRDAKEETEPTDDHDYGRYPTMAWELLGCLNAGRMEPRDVVETLKFVEIAAELPLHQGFPILSWVIENAIVKRARAEEAKRLIRDMFEGMMSASEIAAAVVCRATGKAINVAFRTNKDRDRQIIPAEDRGRAIEYLRDWLRLNASEYLKICDPYFGPKDLDILQMVLSVAPDLVVTVITSRKQQDQEKVEWPWDEYYNRYWHKNFSDQSAPSTEIVVVGGKSGELPIHDRWWLTKGCGLRLGSSFNGIGKNRDSEISVLTPDEVTERLHLTETYTTRQKREHLGEKLTYQFFDL